MGKWRSWELGKCAIGKSHDNDDYERKRLSHDDNDDDLTFFFIKDLLIQTLVCIYVCMDVRERENSAWPPDERRM